MLRRLAVAVTLIVLAGGCTGSDDAPNGGSDNPRRTTATTPPTAPADAGTCEAVWKDGATLPEDYDGCTSRTGETVRDDVTECQDGTRLVVHDDVFYGRTGGPIEEPDIAPLQDTDEFAAVYDDCVG